MNGSGVEIGSGIEVEDWSILRDPGGGSGKPGKAQEKHRKGQLPQGAEGAKGNPTRHAGAVGQKYRHFGMAGMWSAAQWSVWPSGIDGR